MKRQSIDQPPQSLLDSPEEIAIGTDFFYFFLKRKENNVSRLLEMLSSAIKLEIVLHSIKHAQNLLTYSRDCMLQMFYSFCQHSNLQ